MNSPKKSEPKSDDEIEQEMLEKIYKLASKLDPNFLKTFNQAYADMLAETTDKNKLSKN